MAKRISTRGDRGRRRRGAEHTTRTAGGADHSGSGPKPVVLAASLPQVRTQSARTRRRAWTAHERLLRLAAPPSLSAILVVVLAAPSPARFGSAALVAFVVFGSRRLVGRQAQRAAFLRLTRVVYPLASPLLALAVLLFLKVTAVVAGLSVVECAVVCASAGATLVIESALTRGAPPRCTRVGVVGSARTAEGLAMELRRAQRFDFEVVGYVAPPDGEERRDGIVPHIGSPGSLAATVEAGSVDLLLVSSEVSRMEFFDELASASLHLPVRALDLSAFYEEIFGHVPLTSINAAWFQWVVHPRYSAVMSGGKRALDVVVATLAAIVLAPVLAVMTVLVKRDGGPLLYRQTRVGEGGRPFQMLKLRSMRPPGPGENELWWSTPDNHRVTAVGRFMRRTHLDETPQLLNVLRGEMSMVGPRPEQPMFVDRLEREIPFYSRRHLVRPGLTGWAQVTCGYGGSNEGSIWKLCHDLYYVKHRSHGFDLLILFETIGALFADRQFPEDFRLSAFVHRSEPVPPLAATVETREAFT